MAGNPDKDGRKNPRYQMGRRRLTLTPGYHSVLPRVFPFRFRCSAESASHLIGCMMGSGYTGFCLTSHPSTVDGHVHLWLSAECAEFLVEYHQVSFDGLERME